MKEILFLVLSTIGVAFVLADFDLPQGIRSTFGQGIGRGKNYYYPIPLYVRQAKAQGWTKQARPEGPLPSLVMYCAPSLEMCGLYDDTGFIAGSQVAMQKSRWEKKSNLDLAVQGHSTWTVNGEEYWTIQEYYVNEEFLQKSKEDRIASRDDTTTLQLDSMWITSFNGNLLEIPKAEKKLDSIWAKQACYPGMGRHYYYNITNTECTSDRILPWFILYYQGELVATLWAAFGTYAAVDGQRQWFEKPTQDFIQSNFPDAPKCHLQLAANTVSLHKWLIDNPWDAICNPRDPIKIDDGALGTK
ncbi:hypothetical protein NE865_14387 [Phthorimaea operculella]|nr:hypothetical protein NE865_14387 [Phthorimaea operculella]